MKSIINYLLFLSIVCSGSLYAQNVTLKGLLQEQQQPLPFIEVQLQTKDTLIQALTDEAGIFNIEAPKNTYTFQVLSFDHIVYQKSVVLNSATDMGTVVIETSEALSEMVITASKKIIERQADRFN